MTTFLYVLLAILLLGILIAIHEFGHYLTARLTGIPVTEFAIGMGPKLWSRTSKKTGIVYSLRAIPMGGFCAFVGEDDVQQVSKDDPRCWAKQKLWKRFLTVLMGPGMNFILAMVVLFFYMLIGVKEIPTVQPVLDSIVENSAAAQAGLQAGDLVEAVNGEDIRVTSMFTPDYNKAFSDRIAAWKEGDDPLRITVTRDGEPLTVEVTPAFHEPERRYMIGITYRPAAAAVETRALSVGESFRYAGKYFGYYSTAIFDAVIGLFRGQNLDQVSGPVGTVKIISEEVRTYGFGAFIELLAVISVNLGIMNLLPIPGLDGSRLVFMVIEGIRGKPVPPEKEAIVHLVGMVLLFGLMIFLTFRDIRGFFVP